MIDQSEWATDVVFNSQEELQQLYKTVVKESISLFSAKDVMRFTGKKMHGNFQGEVTSHYKDRPEGIRIKHSVKSNSIKMYDKQKSILRVETTINDPTFFKMYRPKEGSSDKPGIYPVRKSVADVKRRAVISENCNQKYTETELVCPSRTANEMMFSYCFFETMRKTISLAVYLDSLAALKSGESFDAIISPFCSPVIYNNKKARAIRTWEEFDSSILKFFGNTGLILDGFRNKDIRKELFRDLEDEKDKKRITAKISRYLWILRAHGLIKRIPKTYKYQPGRLEKYLLTTLIKK